MGHRLGLPTCPTFEPRRIRVPPTGPTHCSPRVLRQRWNRNKRASAYRVPLSLIDAGMHPRGSPCKRLKRVLLFPLGADGEIPRWIVATKESVGSFDPMFAPGVSLVVFVLVPSLLSSYDINHTRVIIPVKRLRNKGLIPSRIASTSILAIGVSNLVPIFRVFLRTLKLHKIDNSEVD